MENVNEFGESEHTLKIMLSHGSAPAPRGVEVDNTGTGRYYHPLSSAVLSSDIVDRLQKLPPGNGFRHKNGNAYRIAE